MKFKDLHKGNHRLEATANPYVDLGPHNDEDAVMKEHMLAARCSYLDQVTKGIYNGVMSAFP
jgi:hypothetical protein